MSIIALRLTRLDPLIDNLRKYAAPKPPFDELPQQYVDLGFSKRAAIGDTVTVEATTLVGGINGLPSGVTVLRQITLLQAVNAGPLTDLIGQPVGATIFAEPWQADVAIKNRIAQAA